MLCVVGVCCMFNGCVECDNLSKMNVCTARESVPKKGRKYRKLSDSKIAKNLEHHKTLYESVVGKYLCYGLMNDGESVIKQEYKPIEVQQLMNGVSGVNFYKNRHLRALFQRTHPNYIVIQKEVKRYFLKEFWFNKSVSIVEKFEQQLGSKLRSLMQERAQLIVRKKNYPKKLATNHKKIMLECSELAASVSVHEFDIYMDYLEKKLLG